jgi:hypothetical protein
MAQKKDYHSASNESEFYRKRLVEELAAGVARQIPESEWKSTVWRSCFPQLCPPLAAVGPTDPMPSHGFHVIKT